MFRNSKDTPTYGDLMAKIKKIERFLEEKRQDEPIGLSNQDTLWTLANMLAEPDISVRKTLEILCEIPYFDRVNGRKTNYPDTLNDIMCRVDRPQNAVIRVTLPAVLPNSKAEWYSKKYASLNGLPETVHGLLLPIISTAIRQNIDANGPFFVPREKCCMVFRRVVPTDCKRKLVDNNNAETGIICNEICNNIGKGDGYVGMDFHYCSIQKDVPEMFVEVVVCTLEDSRLWIFE